MGWTRVSAGLGRPQGPVPQPVVVTETAGELTAPAKVLDANQVVAYNFRAARKLRGWTQEEAARRLAPLPRPGASEGIDLRHRAVLRRRAPAAASTPRSWWPSPSPSTCPWCGSCCRRRVPPTTSWRRPGGRWRCSSPCSWAATTNSTTSRAGWRSSREAGPEASGDVLAEAGGFPPELTWEQFQRSREQALFALVAEEASDIERLMGDLRRVMVRFDELSQRSRYASHPRTGLGALAATGEPA